MPTCFPAGHFQCRDIWYALKSTHFKALFCWSSVLNYCGLPDCSLPCSWMFSQASSLPLHVKLYTALTYITGVSDNPGTPGSPPRPTKSTAAPSGVQFTQASPTSPGPLPMLHSRRGQQKKQF